MGSGPGDGFLQLDPEGVPLAEFDTQQLADLTLAAVAIDGWNRLNIAFRTIPGTYQVPKSHAGVAG
jgi:hypothetical protein